MKRLLKGVSVPMPALIALLVWIVASFFVPSFFSARNISQLMLQLSADGIVTVGMAIVMIGGGFDLSVGSVMALSGIITVIFEPYGLIVALLAGLVAAAAVGLANGLVVTLLRVNPLIATLGSMGAVFGLDLLITNQNPIPGSNMQLMNLNAFVAGIPVQFLLFVVILVAASLVMARTRFGRSIYAVGGNRQAAQAFAIPVDRTVVATYVLSGLLAGIAGILYASQLNTGSPITGQGEELLAITATVLGGVKLTGGAGTTFSTFWGLLVLSIVTNASNLLGINAYLEPAISGAILIGVIVASTVTVRRPRQLNPEHRRAQGSDSERGDAEQRVG